MTTLVEATVGLADTPDQAVLRTAVRDLCRSFSQQYWRELDAERGYPEAFVKALTEAGYLAALIPEEYDGAGLGIAEASIILEEVNRAGGNAAACHAQMYIMGTVLRHGNEEQKRRYLPRIATGELRLQAFGVTEPTAGSDTTKIQTVAERRGDKYVVNGQKVWTSRMQHSDMMLLLARTSPPSDDPKQKTFGLSTFLVDLTTAPPDAVEVRPIRTMMNHETNEVFIRDLEVPAENLIGEEGRGFRYILDGMNAERILIAAECVGDGRFFVDRAVEYDRETGSFSGGRSGRTKACSFRSHGRMRPSRLPISCAGKRRRNSTPVRASGRKPTWRSCWLQKRHGRLRTLRWTRTAGTGSRKSTTSSASSARRVCTLPHRSRTT